MSAGLPISISGTTTVTLLPKEEPSSSETVAKIAEMTSVTDGLTECERKLTERIVKLAESRELTEAIIARFACQVLIPASERDLDISSDVLETVMGMISEEALEKEAAALGTLEGEAEAQQDLVPVLLETQQRLVEHAKAVQEMLSKRDEESLREQQGLIELKALLDSNGAELLALSKEKDALRERRGTFLEALSKAEAALEKSKHIKRSYNHGGS